MMIGNLIVDLLNLYSLIIIIAVVLSWVGASRTNQFVRILYALTDPILDPIRSVIPPIGGSIDISPLIALIMIQVLKSLVIQVFW